MTLEFPDGSTATVHVLPATDDNPAYFEAMLGDPDVIAATAAIEASAIQGKKRRRSRASVTASNRLNKAMRKADRHLYPQHVIKGWEDDVVGDDGKPAPFSEGNCAAWVAALPGVYFDELRNRCADRGNFTKYAMAESAAGNS